MKQFSFFLALMVLVSTYAHAYNLEDKLGGIKGTIIDQTSKQPIPYATVTVKSKSDQQIITGVVTDDKGDFEIKNLEDGAYTLDIQFIGFLPYTKDITINKGTRNVNLGTIELSENVTQLDDVELVAERSTIEQKIDRKVVHIGKDLTTVGASAADIMNNIPSVNLDQDGNLSLRGNQNVRVMVDGKLSNIPVDQLLKQIPSSSIKSIELITNPSAKYNPEGMSGIINIVLHKNANIGFNGNVSAGYTQGEEPKFNSNINLNYRNGKFNLYGTYGNNFGKYVNGGNIYRFDDNTEQFMDMRNNNESHLYKIGIDYYLNDNNTLSFFTNQNIFDGKNNSVTDILFYDDPTLDQTQYFNNANNNHSSQYNFDFKHDFKKEGHNIELEADYNDFTDDEDSNFIFTSGDLPDYQDFVDTDRSQTTVNLDYVNPLTENSKLELGAQTRLFSTDIKYNSTGLSYNSSGDLIATPSTHFVYDMDIYSAYATYGQNFKKWSYQVGARFETVDIKADTNSVRAFTDKYTQVYPSAFVKYTPTEKNAYQISFSRRVDRPGISQVNPIREWSSPRISSYGNPALTPQFTNSIDFNYTRRLKAGSFTGGVFYRQLNDEISRALLIDELDENKLILTYQNFADNNSYGLELSSNYKPTKWWNFNASFDLFNQTQKGFVGSEYAEVDNTSYNFRMNNNFPISKKITLSIFGFYRGPNKSLQFNPKAMYFVNTGARYSFAEGKGTLSLNVNDVFNTMRFAFDATRPYKQNGEFTWESNTLYLGASYNFGSGKNRALRRKNRDDNTKQGGGMF
ncbi:TonB-dependent receptor domain-containing protein [Neptunitalea lumnitzerae]|uniref:TonB-dependent receptor n=1 Tax=Neptunitalea lumnitzerae TaxID=2965509 RepID=A0ABQ5MIS4_9FLAO|nr:TonB-dependent receptor [Neptunitalea sp. Y10]GLB48965.1 TonB-dependent receptor [Neptunitalea sp. Y10]